MTAFSVRWPMWALAWAFGTRLALGEPNGAPNEGDAHTAQDAAAPAVPEDASPEPDGGSPESGDPPPSTEPSEGAPSEDSSVESSDAIPQRETASGDAPSSAEAPVPADELTPSETVDSAPPELLDPVGAAPPPAIPPVRPAAPAPAPSGLGFLGLSSRGVQTLGWVTFALSTAASVGLTAAGVAACSGEELDCIQGQPLIWTGAVVGLSGIPIGLTLVMRGKRLAVHAVQGSPSEAGHSKAGHSKGKLPSRRF